MFLSTVRDELKLAATADGDAAIIASAHAICRGFDSGLIWLQVVKATMSGFHGTLDARQVGFLVGTSVLVYCPQHSSALPPG